jgi:hypothetical protein
MPQLRTYDVVIAHAWRYGEDYYRLVALLDGAPNFQWRNFSVPEHDPVHGRSASAIRAALDEQIRHAHVVLMLAGVYATHSSWMQVEADIAVNYAKPVIGVAPRGNQNLSSVVQGAAVEIVAWNTSSIVDAIRRHAL